jgi:hypothetical protein
MLAAIAPHLECHDGSGPALSYEAVTFTEYTKRTLSTTSIAKVVAQHNVRQYRSRHRSSSDSRRKQATFDTMKRAFENLMTKESKKRLETYGDEVVIGSGAVTLKELQEIQGKIAPKRRKGKESKEEKKNESENVTCEHCLAVVARKSWIAHQKSKKCKNARKQRSNNDGGL